MNRILVIDDEAIVRTSCKRALEPEGYEVELADSGLAGIECLEKDPFNIILLDLKMPDMGGIEVLKVVMERWPDIKVIIVTGYSTVETAVEALRLGAFNHIEKPFTPESLLAAIKEAFEKKE